MKSSKNELTYNLTYKEVVDLLKIIDDSRCQELRLELGDFKLTVIKSRQNNPEVIARSIGDFQKSGSSEPTSFRGGEARIDASVREVI